VPDVLTIPADLTPILRRKAIDRYSELTEAASNAAEALLANNDRERYMNLAAGLVHARASLVDMERLLDELADDIYAEEEWTVEPDRHVLDALRDVVYLALDTDSLEHETPEQVVKAGRRFEGLLALRAQLDGEAVTA
jgi:hypothetical protein